jgi:hypothetical protein
VIDDRIDVDDAGSRWNCGIRRDDRQFERVLRWQAPQY